VSPQQQRVHPLVHVEGVGYLPVALVGDAVLGESAQRPQDDVRGTDADALAIVPERIDVHHVLDAVPTTKVAAEHRREHATVGECRLGDAAPSEVSVNHRTKTAPVELLEN